MSDYGRDHTMPLFDTGEERTAPFVADSETSRDAAESIAPFLTGLRARVYSAVARAGDHGLTCDECEVQLSMRHQTCSARFRELTDSGVITRTHKKRPTRSGRDAFVYCATMEETK